MDIFDPVTLSRIQFAFVISFHIIFPAFTIGLAAWLATIEGMRYFTGNPLYRRMFDFWLRIFAVSFGMGVVTGIVMAFQFGTNWGVLAERTGSIQGPLLGYESFTAFMLEASFFGVMLLGRNRVLPGFYLFACCMVSLGTMCSSFWILANNSWMQAPVGHEITDGRIMSASLVYSSMMSSVRNTRPSWVRSWTKSWDQTWFGRSGRRRTQEPSPNQSRPFFACFCGIFSPSRRQIRSTRLWFTCPLTGRRIARQFCREGASVVRHSGDHPIAVTPVGARQLDDVVGQPFLVGSAMRNLAPCGAMLAQGAAGAALGYAERLPHMVDAFAAARRA